MLRNIALKGLLFPVLKNIFTDNNQRIKTKKNHEDATQKTTIYKPESINIPSLSNLNATFLHLTSSELKKNEP